MALFLDFQKLHVAWYIIPWIEEGDPMQIEVGDPMVINARTPKIKKLLQWR